MMGEPLVNRIPNFSKSRFSPWHRVVCVVMVCLGLAQGVQAQGGPVSQQPVMQNVFFNVLWGSAVGATIGASATIIASQDKATPTGFRDGVVFGATGGAVIGLGVGLILVFNGITFMEEGSNPLGLISQNDPTPPALVSPLTPVEVRMDPDRPGQVSEFRMLVLNQRF